LFGGLAGALRLFVAELVSDGALVVLAEAGEFAGETAELTETLMRVFDVAQGVNVDGELGGQDGGDVFGDGDAFPGGVQAEIVGLLGGPAGLFAQELVASPIEVAAFAPFGEVLRADGQAGELFGDDFLDFGQLVEPSDERGSGFAIFEALVELFADGFGQAGDFAGTSFHGIFCHIFCHRDTGSEKWRRSQTAATTECMLLIIWSGFNTNAIRGKTYGKVLVGSDWGGGEWKRNFGKKRAKTRLFPEWDSGG